MLSEIWTQDQVDSINGFQQSGLFHPFTCGKCRADLVATQKGFVCPTEGCDYTQDWCHDFMANGDWKQWINPTV